MTAIAAPTKAVEQLRFPTFMLVVAFLSGWVLMMLEMLSARLLAPHYGYSVYQWGALIGIVLASMSAGYYAGARIGDGPRALLVLKTAIAVSLAWIVLTPLVLESALMPTRAYGPVLGCVIASVLLAAVPSFGLAIDTPILARLCAASGIARTTGRLYAVSTVGSIGGTFFAAFVSIPFIGVYESYAIAVVLLAISLTLVLIYSRSGKQAAALLLVPAVYLLAPAPAKPDHVLIERDTVYNRIYLDKHGDTLALYLNYRDGAQTVLRKDSVLTGSYYDTFALAPALHGHGPRKVLFLGSAGGTALRQMTAFWPRLEVVGIELDPAVSRIARTYFGLDREGSITLVDGEARSFVNRAPSGGFDIVAIDLYVTGHIPFYCTTREFFAEVARVLAPDGLVMMNVLAIHDEQILVGPLARTMATSFQSVYRLGRGNVILIAAKERTSLAEMQRRLDAVAKSGADGLDRLARETRDRVQEVRASPEWPILTDKRNDIDFRSFRSFYGRF